MKYTIRGALFALAFLAAPAWAGEKLTITPRLVGESTANIAAYVPDTCAAVGTVRLGALLQKLPLEKQLGRSEFGCGMAEQLGFRIADVDTLTVVLPMLDLNSLTMFFTLHEPLEQTAYLKKYFPDAKADATKKYFFSEQKTAALCFLNPRTLIVTANEHSMQRCLEYATYKKRTPGLADVVRETAAHDLALWVSASVIPKEALAIPPGVEAFTASIDVGPTLQVCVRAMCEDDKSQAWAKKMLQGGCDLIRAQLLMVNALSQMSEALPEAAQAMGQMLNTMGLPTKMLAAFEKGLQKADLTTDATAVTLAATIPLDAKTLRSELLGVLRMIEANGLGAGIFGTTKVVSGQTLPSPHYLQHAPETITPVSPNPLPREAVPSPFPAPTTPGPLPMVGYFPPTTPLPPPTLPPNALPSIPPTAPGTTMPTPLPPSAAPPATLPMPTVPVLPVAAVTPPKEITITVANTCSDSVVIYEVCVSGEYKPVGTVDKGESIDAKLKAGQRYLAIMPAEHSPYQRTVPRLVTYTPEKANDIWLLRPKKE